VGNQNLTVPQDDGRTGADARLAVGLHPFERAAELFRIMSAPIRLQIICVLKDGEQQVGELLLRIPTTQSNLSQHLATLYRAGVLSRRRSGPFMYYRLSDAQFGFWFERVCEHLQRALPQPHH
jgi:DNA-binding transcriptional ArsR family regulator